MQHFMQDCDELSEWLGDKMIAAQDETYRDAKNIHSKYMRHQAFESEIAANKDRLNKLIQVNITFFLNGIYNFTTIISLLSNQLSLWHEYENSVINKTEDILCQGHRSRASHPCIS